jgi:hypothetical protein
MARVRERGKIRELSESRTLKHPNGSVKAKKTELTALSERERRKTIKFINNNAVEE